MTVRPSAPRRTRYASAERASGDANARDGRALRFSMCRWFPRVPRRRRRRRRPSRSIISASPTERSNLKTPGAARSSIAVEPAFLFHAVEELPVPARANASRCPLDQTWIGGTPRYGRHVNAPRVPVGFEPECRVLVVQGVVVAARQHQPDVEHHGRRGRLAWPVGLSRRHVTATAARPRGTKTSWTTVEPSGNVNVHCGHGSWSNVVSLEFPSGYRRRRHSARSSAPARVPFTVAQASRPFTSAIRPAGGVVAASSSAW